MSIYLGETPLANTGYNKANTDLSNLTSQGQNIANWSNNVTNCITEIPQDIKLELNNGTLTLKAGSRVYVPNGSGVFNAVTTPADKSWGQTTYAGGKLMVFYRNQYNDLFSLNDYACYSGSTAPTASTNMIWYDTANNKIKWTSNGGSTWNDEGLSLPITNSSYANGTGFTAIDQVFNGFGYIGSTVFALPGVKGLIPNGRNADGTLKNIEFTTSSVLTETQTWNSDWVHCTIYNVNNMLGIGLYADTDLIYDENKNVFVFNGSQVCVATISHYRMLNRIYNWSPKTAFHALDYNDSSTISGWAMPSSRYIDLTLGATGATYTAPANGYFNLYGIVSTGNGYVDITGKIQIGDQNYAATGSVWGVVPVLKGDTVTISYSNFTVQRFRFIYAEGEANV